MTRTMSFWLAGFLMGSGLVLLMIGFDEPAPRHPDPSLAVLDQTIPRLRDGDIVLRLRDKTYWQWQEKAGILPYGEQIGAWWPVPTEARAR